MDSATNNKKFKVYRAGAGSGKTFQLIREFLSLALQKPQEDYYKHILAITFTNAAAHEMRHRFLGALRHFANSALSDLEQDALFVQVRDFCGIPPHELQQRAALAYRHVLHHYDQLSIGTIDSYAQRLVRSFAFELNLAGDFQLELDSDDFYDRVIGACLDEVGIDPELTKYLMALVESKLDDQSSWKARPILAGYASYLKNERGHRVAMDLIEKPVDFFLEARKKSISYVINIRKERQRLAREIMAVLNKYSIDEDDFAGKSRGYLGNLKKLLAKGVLDSSKSLQNAYADRKFFTKESRLQFNPDDEALIVQLLEQLMETLVGKGFAREFIYDQISRNILGLGVLKHVAEKAQMVRDEEHVLLIDDLHQRVHDVLCEQSSPFLFERLGVKYKHIMIDEFQDTSTKQWSNMLPLFSNALGEGHDTMLVGDAKQSIYRFRGGNARQFVELPEVPLAHLDANESRQFSANYLPFVLDVNRRSDETIVQFNNALYRSLSSRLSGMQSVYDDVAQQSVRPNAGWVTARPTEATQWVQQTVTLVKDALDRRYLPSEIAVLVLRKKHGYAITQELARCGIRVQSEESLLLIHSHKVAFLESWLSFIEVPMRQDTILSLVSNLERSGLPVDLAGFCERALAAGLPLWTVLREVLQEHAPALLEGISDDIYDEAVRAVACMQWPVDGQLEFFLNELFQKAKIEFWSRSKWNEWWSNKRESMSMKVGADPMAVRMMTVHKSKGLEFPVVIFCVLGKQKEAEDWFDLPPNDCSVPSLNLGVKRSNAKTRYTQIDAGLEQQNQRYLEELELEELNVRYVATTRPRNILHLIVDAKNHKDYWDAVANVPGVKQEGEHCSWGEPGQIGGKEVPIDTKEKSPVLKTSPSIAASLAQRKSEEQLWGDFLHQCLSRVRVPKDVEVAVELNYLPHRHATWMSKDDVKSNLHHLIDQPSTRSWFEGWDEAWIERDIITPRGDVIRPDRVIRRDDTFIIVDYKTGKQEDQHQAQIKRYAEVLADMYPSNRIEAWLWYISNNLLVQVI